MTKMLHEGNQKHNFISSSGSGIVINYGSGSNSQKAPVPVPQHCIFLAFLFIYKINMMPARSLKNICSVGTRLPRILYCDFGR